LIQQNEITTFNEAKINLGMIFCMHENTHLLVWDLPMKDQLGFLSANFANFPHGNKERRLSG
jgi:hypothetical protein